MSFRWARAQERGRRGELPPSFESTVAGTFSPSFHNTKPLVHWAGSFRQTHTLVNEWKSWPLVISRTRIETFALLVRARTDGHVHHWVHRLCPPSSQILPAPLKMAIWLSLQRTITLGGASTDPTSGGSRKTGNTRYVVKQTKDQQVLSLSTVHTFVILRTKICISI